MPETSAILILFLAAVLILMCAAAFVYITNWQTRMERVEDALGFPKLPPLAITTYRSKDND